VLRAAKNHTVDLVLAMLLMTGGVIGAQIGAVAGDKLKAEQLRFLLAIMVLLMGMRMAWSLIAAPQDIYSIAPPIGGH
jgi:uncharacterized membrane protein YfcA